MLDIALQNWGLCCHNLLTSFVRFKYHAESRLIIMILKSMICA